MAFVSGLLKKFFKACCLTGFCLSLWACHSDNKVLKLPSFASQVDSTFSLKLGTVEMKVDAGVGARIKSFKIDGQELLVTAKELDTAMWGSVFWTSPQAEWNWPPLVTLDSAPYAVAVDQDHLIFTSKVDEKTGYQFVKKFSVDTNKNAFHVQYTVINQSALEKHLAAWEVTRLKPHGHMFFPKGDIEPFSGIFYPLKVTNTDGISWFDYDPALILQNHHKFMTDGREGWMAYTDKRFVLVKEFQDVPTYKMVPGEAEIGIFASSKKDYLEMAVQGEYTSLAPGQKLDWEIYWHLESLPEGMDNLHENAELTQFVRDMLNKTKSAVQ